MHDYSAELDFSVCGGSFISGPSRTSSTGSFTTLPALGQRDSDLSRRGIDHRKSLGSFRQRGLNHALPPFRHRPNLGANPGVDSAVPMFEGQYVQGQPLPPTKVVDGNMLLNVTLKFIYKKNQQYSMLLSLLFLFNILLKISKSFEL